MKKLLSVILVLCLVLSVSGITAFASEGSTVTIPFTGNTTLTFEIVEATGADTAENVIIESGFTSIGNYAFSDQSFLRSVEIPSSVTFIGSDAFNGCTSLASIEISPSVTLLGTMAFAGCTSLMSIEIPPSVTTINMRVFQNCTSLASVIIPSSVTSIGTNAFLGCTSLATVNMGHSDASELTWTDAASYSFDIVWNGASLPPEVNPGEPQEGKVQINIELPKTTVKVEQDLFLTVAVDPETGEVISSGYKIKNLNQCPLTASVRSITLPASSEYTLVAPDAKNWNELKKNEKFLAFGILQDSEQDNTALSNGLSGTKWSTDITGDVLLGEIYAGGTVYFSFDMKYSHSTPTATPLSAEMEVVIGLA